MSGMNEDLRERCHMKGAEAHFNVTFCKHTIIRPHKQHLASLLVEL